MIAIPSVLLSRRMSTGLWGITQNLQFAATISKHISTSTGAHVLSKVNEWSSRKFYDLHPAQAYVPRTPVSLSNSRQYCLYNWHLLASNLLAIAGFKAETANKDTNICSRLNSVFSTT